MLFSIGWRLSVSWVRMGLSGEGGGGGSKERREGGGREGGRRESEREEGGRVRGSENRVKGSDKK